MDNFPIFLKLGLFNLLYLIGIVLALVYWRRCPTACAFLSAASLLLLIASVVELGVPILFPREIPIFGGVSTVGVINWVAYGLLLMAVFADRKEPKESRPQPVEADDDDGDEWGAPASRPSSDASGIQQRRP